MGTAFFDDKHKMQKLHGTVCMYKGEPYYISCSSRYDPQRGELRLKPNHVILCPLGPGTNDTKKQLEIDYRDDDFDYAAPPLGYTNWQNEAFYMMRVPFRSTYQGLHVHYLANAENTAMRDKYGWFTSLAARDCILGNYLSLEEALRLTSPNTMIRYKSAAFKRTLAVEGIGLGAGHTLLFKGRGIGNKMKNDTVFVLYPGPDRSFLIRYLERNGVAAC